MHTHSQPLRVFDAATQLSVPTHHLTHGCVCVCARERVCRCVFGPPPHLGGDLEEGVQCQLCGLSLGVGEDDGATVSAAVSAGTLTADTWSSQRLLTKDAWGQWTRSYTR
jgi:hypothetical protein